MFCIFIGFNKKKMVGVKIPRVGVKITRGSLTPGGQAAQGVKINCYTGTFLFVIPLVSIPEICSSFSCYII